MKAHEGATAMEEQAAEALSVLLRQVSSIRTKDIRFQRAGSHRAGKILADIDVLGRKHKLVCNVVQDEPLQVKKALQKLRTVNTASSDATAVLIAPHLSPKAKAMCEESHVGFLDLDGNARLVLDDVFISRKCVHGASPAPSPTRISA